MANAKSWDRAETSADCGFIHDESLDRMAPDIYSRVGRTSVIEDQTFHMFSIFNDFGFCESLNREFFRPVHRSGVSLGTTNFMTESRDYNKQVSSRSWEILKDFIIQILAHDNCYDAVTAVLAWHIVAGGISTILPDTLDVEVDEDFAAYIKYFESQAAGCDNSESWTTRVTKILPKWHIATMLECSNNKVATAEWYLKDICFQLFSEYLPDEVEY